jgi:hypothetical protein
MPNPTAMAMRSPLHFLLILTASVIVLIPAIYEKSIEGKDYRSNGKHNPSDGPSECGEADDEIHNSYD